MRKGSKTIKATEDLHQQMIDQRHGKIRLLLEWLNKEITVEGSQLPKVFPFDPKASLLDFPKQEWSVGVHQAMLKVVNAHWVTFGVQSNQRSPRTDRSEPIEKLLLSWDDEKQRLKVVVKNEPLQ